MIRFGKKIREKNGASVYDLDGHEHAYCLLGEFLTTLIVATKHNTEADVDANLITKGIDRIKRQVESQESRILNCYKLSCQIPNISPAAQIVPTDLLKDLLDDSAVIDLSKTRYFLGIPSKAKIALIRTRQKIREILAVPRYRKYLAMASKLGNIATKQANIELPEIDAQRENAFSPPFISLDEMKPNCLRTNRELSEIDPLHFY